MFVLEIFYNDGSKYLYGPFDSRNQAVLKGVHLKTMKNSWVSSFEVRAIYN